MASSRLSGRYAKSLIILAKENNTVESCYGDMQLVDKVYKENRELQVMLKSPVIKTDTKQKILNLIFKDSVSDMVLKFINIITNKKREKYLGEIATHFISQYKSMKEIVTAKVTSPFSLTKEQKEKILALVNNKYQGSGVELQEEIDKDLIGGFVLRVGDNQIDHSVQDRLRRLKKTFEDNPYIREF